MTRSSWRRLRWAAAAALAVASLATGDAVAQDSAYYNNAGALATSSAPPPATGNPGIIAADNPATQLPGVTPVATPGPAGGPPRVPPAGGGDDPTKPAVHKVKRCRTRHGRRTCRLFVNGSLTRSC